ncbi:fasciclin-like arabinogalactan protein 12 [Euphorbia lathyris]|uniref:fasciclin-like arabinogalactan protein 12 n=1 Tax=Euphorbia lathyris TaxID=212925 RepID=UPI0033143079
MNHKIFFSISLIFILFHSTNTLAQSPAAAPVQSPPAPPPAQPPSAVVAATPGPTDVVKILEKAGHFTVLVRLLKATHEDSELLSELNNTNNGVTIFAPNDNAFSGLKAGTLNTLRDEQKVELMKFHVIPGFLSASQFQTVTNPVRTQAGSGDRVSLNVTTVGNFINITTGLTNASIVGTVYTDNQLAIYQVDKVLLPVDVFTPKPPAPAPAPGPAQEKPAKDKSTPSVDSPAASKDVSGAVSVNKNWVFVVVVLVAGIF